MPLYAVTSDIHLAHLKTPTEHIIDSFKNTILTEQNKSLDILFISGDLFDRLIDLNTKEIHPIIEFFNYLLTYCTNNDILLRVLNGTPSHDWGQSQLLVKLNDIRTNKCNLRYHKQLDIEYIESLQQHVLYIPDEWSNSHEEIEKQVQAKLIEHSISQVDIAILHGQFGYQVAGKPFKGLFYQEDYFLSLVRGFIHIGHYHVYSHHDRIIANGSLERLAHGEEAPKGYVLVNNDRFTFIENTNAYTYKTINVTPSVTIDKLDKLIHKYPPQSHIRLLLSQDHPFNLTFSELKLRYYDYNLKKINKDRVSEKALDTYILSDTELEFSNKFVMEGNIHSLLIDTITSKHSLDSVEMSKLLSYIEVFKETISQLPLPKGRGL